MIFYYRDICIKLGRLWNLFAVVAAAALALRWEDFVRTPGPVVREILDIGLPLDAIGLSVGLLACWYFIFALFGIDRTGRTLFDGRTFLDILLAVVLGTAVLGYPVRWVGDKLEWRSTAEVGTSETWKFLVYFAIILFVLCLSYRLLVYMLLEFGRKGVGNLRHVVLIGCNPRAARFARRVMTTTGYGYHIIGVFDDDVGRASVFNPPVPYMGAFSDVQEFLRSHPVDEVMLFLPIKSYYDEISRVVGMCRELAIDTSFPYGLFERDGPGIASDEMEGLSLEELRDLSPGEFAERMGVPPADADSPDARLAQLDVHAGVGKHGDGAVVDKDADSRRLLTLTYGFSPPQDWRHFIKYAMDFLVSAILLLILAVPMLIVAAAIKLTSPGPVIFVQQRIGFNRRRISFYKFRTMVQDAEMRIAELEHLNEMGGAAFKIANDPRVTRLGAFLRKTSIDELPQLFNVLKGDMSLVGPRPLSVRDYDRFYRDAHRRRFSVRPGITCIWQISGRNKLTFEQWMQLDLEYIDNWSLGGDIVILLKTLPAVLSRDGAT